MNDPDDGLEKGLPRWRFAVRACVCGLILAWALISTLQGADRRPAHLTWAGILVSPATLLVAIRSYVASVLWLPHRCWAASLPVWLVGCPAMLALSWAERGYGTFWTARVWILRPRISARKKGVGPFHHSPLE